MNPVWMIYLAAAPTQATGLSTANCPPPCCVAVQACQPVACCETVKEGNSTSECAPAAASAPGQGCGPMCG